MIFNVELVRIFDLMSNVESILLEVKHLERDEQLMLLEKIVAIIRKERTSPTVKLSSLSGLGAEIWKGVDIDKYIENEREW